MPMAHGQIKETWSTPTVGYYTVTKKSDVPITTPLKTDVKGGSHKKPYCVIAFTRNVQKSQVHRERM